MIRNLYPFSTIDGKVIPLDIIRPMGVLRVPFTGVATTLADLAMDTPVLVLRSTEDCFVRFGVAAEVPAASLVANELFLGKDEVAIVAPHSSKYSVISDGVDGVLTIQALDRWIGLADELSYRN